MRNGAFRYIFGQETASFLAAVGEIQGVFSLLLPGGITGAKALQYTPILITTKCFNTHWTGQKKKQIRGDCSH